MENPTPCINPLTNKIVGYSKLDSAEEVKAKVNLARKAQEEWALKSFNAKSEYFIRLRNLLVENADEIAKVTSQDNGKVKIDALTAEVLPVAMAITFFLKNGKKFLSDKKLKSGNIFLFNKKSFIRRVPYGVVGIIAPWNYPFTIPMFDIITALMCGNAVIFKAATDTQLVGRKIEELFINAEFPENILSYINIPGSKAGDLLIESGVNKIFFTGSTEVGRELSIKTASKLIPISLELGGNDPMIILEDADVDRAVNGAVWAGFQNCGQSCGGVERIYVNEKIYDEFLVKIKYKIENMIAGDSDSYTCDFGVMTNLTQKKIVELHVQDAIAKGAEIFAESKLEGNSFNALKAVVLINVNHDMKLMKEETFGPVVGVMKFNDYEEAIKLANDSELGLTASVWSRSNKKAIEIGKKLNVGVVNINDHLMSHGMAETPWGGFKASGGSRSHGEFGFHEMTQIQVIVKDVLPFVKKNLWWHPYDRKVYEGIIGLLKFMYDKKSFSKIKGAIQLIRIIPRIFKG